MLEIEIIELLNLIMMSIALGLFVISVIKVKKLMKYIPGAITLWIVFLATNLEALFLPELFNFIEHSFFLLTAFLIFIAVFTDFSNMVIKNKEKKEK